MKVGDIVELKIASMTETKVVLESVKSGKQMTVFRDFIKPRPLRPGKARRPSLGVNVAYTVIAVCDDLAWVQLPFERPEVLPAADFENI